MSDGCVTMADSNKNVTDNEVSLSSIHVDQVEKSDTGLNVTVSVTTGNIGGVWSENSSVPASSTGTLPNISIDTSKFVLKTEGHPGWYLPTDALKLGDMAVKVLTPAFTGVELANDPTGNPIFTIQTQNMPENAKVEVALEKTSVTTTADIDKATIKQDAKRGDAGKYSVTFDTSKFEPNKPYYLWFRYGSDWAYQNVTDRPTYTFSNTTVEGGGITGGGGTEGGNPGGSEGGGSGSTGGSGNTTEGSQTGA